MSTGRRLAKRSIIGTKVCAPGPDGLWYSGVIQDVRAPPTATITSPTGTPLSASAPSLSPSTDAGDSGSGLHANTKYIVRFDFKTQAMQGAAAAASTAEATTPNACSAKSVIIEARRAAAAAHISPAQTLRRNAMIKEFRESDLVGPGFRSILGIQLQPGQRVFLTHNGRETSGDVLSHDANTDEVLVKITTIGTEEPVELKKRLEEVRLLESRRSARLADQDRDTDFARLADMGGDRRKSHSIEVPLSSLTPHNNSRKRPPHDCSQEQCDEEEMNECNAAVILMNLSNSPKSPKNGEKWLGTSPGSSSSSASWSSGSSSPPLSDDGHATHTSAMSSDATAARIRTTSVSTSDEGIVVDFKEETPRKKRASKRKYKCTWKGCKSIELTSSQIERHIRTVHLGQGATEHEEDFYYTEIEDDDDDGKTPSPTSPPTLSHRDMARPPHEDPEYQRQFVGHFKQGRAVNQQQQHQYHSNSNSNTNGKAIHHIHNSSQHQHQLQSNSNTSGMPTSPLAHHNYTWPSTAATITNTSPSSATSSPTHTAAHYQQQQQPQPQQQQQHNQPQQQNSSTTFIKHARSSPRPSQLSAPYPSPTYVHHQHHNYSSSPSASSGSGSSSNSSSTIQHSNSSANTVLQQLSQQNITVTAHHNGHNQQQSSQQQQHTLSAITITPNYQPHQQMRGGQQQSPSVANGSLQLATTSSQHAVPHMSPASSCSSSSQHQQQLQPHAGLSVKHMPNSPNRRTRGENKKCRKVYGMERKDQWCTQCRWKKACSRFND